MMSFHSLVLSRCHQKLNFLYMKPQILTSYIKKIKFKAYHPFVMTIRHEFFCHYAFVWDYVYWTCTYTNAHSDTHTDFNENTVDTITSGKKKKENVKMFSHEIFLSLTKSVCVLLFLGIFVLLYLKTYHSI